MTQITFLHVPIISKTFTKVKSVSGNRTAVPQKLVLFLKISVFSENHVSINEVNSLIEIHPNPTTDILNVSISEEGVSRLEIYNLMGKLVLSKELQNGNNIIDVSNLNAGMYQSRITSGNNILSTEKLIISK